MARSFLEFFFITFQLMSDENKEKNNEKFMKQKSSNDCFQFSDYIYMYRIKKNVTWLN